MSELAPSPAPTDSGDASALADGATAVRDLHLFADIDPRAWTALAALSRDLHAKEADLHGTLQAILENATRVIAGARFAGVNLLRNRKFEPQAVLGEAPHKLDLLQQSTGVGPCVDASREQITIAVPDMRVELRWEEYAALAVQWGVLSMLCVPLWVDDLRLG